MVAMLSMSAVLAFAGLAIDLGQFRFQKEQMQTAADAAALAAAIESSSCGSTADCTAMQQAAQQALVENGFSGSSLLTQCAANSNTGLTLTVNNGPCALGSTSADPNYGNASYVETVVSGPVSMMLARVVGIKSLNVSVRAEAHSSSAYCLYTSTSNTGSSGPEAILLNGGTLTSECGIYDDSGASDALASDSGASITSTKFLVHGGWSPDNGGSFSSTPVTGAAAVADPLTYLTAPAEGTVQQSGNYTPGSSTTISPGAYLGGININSGITLTLSSGTYYLGGSIVNSGTLIGTAGVTIYFASGSMTMNSGSTAQLVAPTTGSLPGILIWEASGDSTAMIINGNSTAEYQGTIYAPSAQLTLNSAGNTAAYTIVDVSSMILDSGANFTMNNNYSSLPNGSPVKGGNAALVE